MVGERIKRLREERRLSRRELAERANISVGLLEQIEAGGFYPSVATLIQLAGALGVSLKEVMGESSAERLVVVRSYERREVERRPRTGPSRSGYYYQSLASKEGIDAFLVVFEEKKEDERVFFQHQGREFLFVLEGTLELCLDDECVVLEPGDSASYESTYPHSLRGIGGPAKAIVVVYGE